MVFMTEKINEVAHSSEGEDFESTSPPIYPAWLPAKLPEHECVLPLVGLPHASDHVKESES